MTKSGTKIPVVNRLYDIIILNYRFIALVAVFMTFLSTVTGCSDYENPITKWEDGIIPYYLTGEFSNEDLDAIDEAMTRWEDSCGVWFQMVTPRSYAYEIIKTGNSNDWASSVGENNIFNHMYYGSGSSPVGHVTHELGHCLGLLHEHQRPDRDNYVIIVWEKIYPEYAFNFDIRDNPLLVEEDFEYDYSSIMHYHSKGFSIDGTETIIPLGGHEIERTDDLTENDKEKCRAIYGHPFTDREEPPPY